MTELFSTISLPMAMAAAGIFCVVPAAWDFREKRCAWAICGLLFGAQLLIVPIPTHAVKIDLPVAG